MADEEPTEVIDPRDLFGWRLSPYFKKPQHVPYVLTIFGPLRRSTLREIVIALDAWVTDYGFACKHRPVKAPAAELRYLQSFGRPFLNVWEEIAPLLYPEIITRAIGTRRCSKKAGEPRPVPSEHNGRSVFARN